MLRSPRCRASNCCCLAQGGSPLCSQGKTGRRPLRAACLCPACSLPGARSRALGEAGSSGYSRGVREQGPSPVQHFVPVFLSGLRRVTRGLPAAGQLHLPHRPTALAESPPRCGVSGLSLLSCQLSRVCLKGRLRCGIPRHSRVSCSGRVFQCWLWPGYR